MNDNYSINSVHNFINPNYGLQQKVIKSEVVIQFLKVIFQMDTILILLIIFIMEFDYYYFPMAHF